MNELDCVKWNGAGANDRELPESTSSSQVNEMNKQQLPTRGHAWQSSVSNDRPKTWGRGLFDYKFHPITSLSARTCGQGMKCTNSLWSFWTFQNSLRSPQRQNKIILVFFTVWQRCKHLSCLLFTFVCNPTVAIPLLFSWVEIFVKSWKRPSELNFMVLNFVAQYYTFACI